MQIFSGTANEPLARVTCNYHRSFSRQPFSSEVSCLVPMNVPIVNQPPPLNAINNLAMNENAGLQTVSLSGITSGATNDRPLEGCKGTLYLLAAGCRPDWHAGKRAATPWRQPSWLPVNAASSRVSQGRYSVQLRPS